MERRKFILTSTLTAIAVLLQCKSKTNKTNSVDGYFASLEYDILYWIESVRYKKDGWGRFKYNIHMYRDYGLESSAFAIQLLNKFGELDSISDKQIDEAISFFMSCLDLEDGFFKDPLLSVEDKVSEKHSWEHVWAHMSGVSTSALKLMGKTDLPKKESPPFADLRKVDPEEWLLSLPWENPWMEAEHLTRVVKWYWNQLPEEQRTANEPKTRELLDAFEKHILDPKTGMPTMGGCSSRNVAMAGAFKAYGSYLAIGRPIPYAEKAMDFVLDLQRKDGAFGENDDPQPLTINWDSMWDIRVLNNQLKGSYRMKDIQDAGNRQAEYLLKVHRKPDGGFSFYPDYCLPVHNSVRISDKKPESDSLGIIMAVQCMEYADEWNAMK